VEQAFRAAYICRGEGVPQFERRFLFLKYSYYVLQAIDKVVDKLPTWVKFNLIVLTVLGSAYCISRDGFWSFLLRLIFIP
jgi:hypothetical protein